MLELLLKGWKELSFSNIGRKEGLFIRVYRYWVCEFVNYRLNLNGDVLKVKMEYAYDLINSFISSVYI